VGRGTGVDDEGLARKRAAVQESVRRIAGIRQPHFEIGDRIGGVDVINVKPFEVAAAFIAIDAATVNEPPGRGAR